VKRGLPQAVVEEGRFQEASLQTPFRFECKRCGHCCFTCEILLTPFDILRLCQFLRMSTSEFLLHFARISTGPGSGLPVCTLDFERVAWERGNDPELAPCPFLTVLDGHPACGVYPARPGCCRSYPLGRMVRMEGGVDVFQATLFLQEVHCAAVETQQEYTVAEWIEHEGLAEYQQAHNLWITQLIALGLMRGRTQSLLPPETLDMLANLWYNFSVCPGESLEARYEVGMEDSRRMVEDITGQPLPQVHAIRESPTANSLGAQVSIIVPE